ncbi:MAG: hypothetical protein A2Y63_06855 [Candidatus Riflebacteria bacterium RBG_13_59_9]|nr:MAG: hypothetical protein A2Y63_06855 [Candidatus Riflebacteria bacterium RBG_13_59_9]
MSILGLDLGEKRIGVAIAEAPSFVAVPLMVLEAEPWKAFVDHLRQLTQERAVEKLVVGLPLQTNGREGQAAKAAREMAEKLGAACGLPVAYQDERFTSNAAEDALAHTALKPSRRQKRRDAVAAALILEAFLSSAREES